MAKLTATFIRRGTDTDTTDSQGNPVPVEPEIFEVPGCIFAPSTTDERAQVFGAQVITGATLFAPFGTVVLSSDQIEIPGEGLFHVDGKRANWSSPFDGRGRGVAIPVKEAD